MSIEVPVARFSYPDHPSPALDQDDLGAGIGDRHHRLWEAAHLDCCPDGDLLALMPSVDRTDTPWIDGRGWISRIIGF